jgi:membrane associated rhomboid family serine protease
MVYAAVGIKCPECAGQPTGARAATRKVSRAAGAATGAVVTKTLIAINVAVFLVSIAQGSGGLQPADSFVRDWALRAPEVADGEWYRLVTSAFLHANLLHLAFNMLMLWWFGQALEAALGRGRFVGVYLVSALAGSAGALLLSPDSYTLGASGAVFGILGAGLILERRQIYVFGGGALVVILLNLAFTFLGPGNISVGGHLGGLIGGMLAVLGISAGGRHPVYGRLDPLTVLTFLGLGAASVAVAYLRVRGYA